MLVVGLGCVSLLGAGDAPATKPGAFVLDSTCVERTAASPRVQTAAVDSLVLPHPHATNVHPEPYFCRARSRPTVYPAPDRVLWQVVPRKEAHAAFLQKHRDADTRPKRLALVAWCERNDLPACAEFELRALLQEIGNFRHSGYAHVNRWWLKHASCRQTAYVFPLPVRGEWYVVPDASGHHRLKHGAAFAFDLVIRKGGKMYHDDRGTLSNHYAFARPVLAQADGVVLEVTDSHPDLPPGQTGARTQANTVTVNYGGGIVGFYGHLKQDSAKVKPGERVRAGQPLAEVGNSGSSGLPHLHFSMLDEAYFSVKGRFRYELKGTDGWRVIDGEDLKEGITVRNAGYIFTDKKFSPRVGPGR